MPWAKNGAGTPGPGSPGCCHCSVLGKLVEDCRVSGEGGPCATGSRGFCPCCRPLPSVQTHPDLRADGWAPRQPRWGGTGHLHLCPQQPCQERGVATLWFFRELAWGQCAQGRGRSPCLVPGPWRWQLRWCPQVQLRGQGGQGTSGSHWAARPERTMGGQQGLASGRSSARHGRSAHWAAEAQLRPWAGGRCLLAPWFLSILCVARCPWLSLEAQVHSGKLWTLPAWLLSLGS